MRILCYLARQSAGQCGPCLNGLPVLAGTLARLAAGERNPRLPREVHRLDALVNRRGACHHSDDSVSAALVPHARRAVRSGPWSSPGLAQV
jgi:NADH:ubiquinone oxidoreductase subunit F (NADH-binding)